MLNLTLRHEFDCTTDMFWTIFFDKDFNLALFRDTLDFSRFEVLEQRETDKEIIRRVSASPKLDVPAPVAKLLGPGFSYVEEGTFDRASKRWQWKTIPSAMKDKLRQTGTVVAEEAGESRCRRVAHIEAEAKIFGIGGMVESTLEKSLRAGWDKSADFMRTWIKDKAR
jgi:hypothetical protein